MFSFNHGFGLILLLAMAVPFYSAPVVGCCSTSCIVIEQNWLVILSGLAILAPSLPVVLFAFAVIDEYSGHARASGSWHWVHNGTLGGIGIGIYALLVNAAQVYIGICVLMIGCKGSKGNGEEDWQKVHAQDFVKADAHIGSKSIVDEENPAVGKNDDAVVVSA
jgi:hypothetical protein